MATYDNGMTVVGVTATKVCTVDAESSGVLITNNGAAAVFFGGPNVATSGANQGISVAAGATQLFPSIGGVTHDLYGIIAAATANITFMMPQAGS